MTNRPDPELCTWPALDVAGWPAARVPFPVSAPYTPRPDLARLGSVIHGVAESRLLDVDATLPQALRAKLARLQAQGARCVALEPGLAHDPQAVWTRIRRAALAIAEREASLPATGAPRLLRVAGDEIEAVAAGWSMPAAPGAPFALRAHRADARPVVDWIARRPPAERPLHALALAIQEDLAWIEAASAGDPVRAALLHVCWPSGWRPADKIGLDFGAIHAPVADGGPLRAAAAPLSRVLVTQGPFVRFVWTIAADGTPSRHPDERPDERPEAAPAAPGTCADALWFRAERQVTLPMGVTAGAAGGAALFLIRLHLQPLGQAAPDPARRARLLASLASMSDATLAYKRLAAIRAIVERDWGGEGARAAPADA
jgi:hypothetical protein